MPRLAVQGWLQSVAPSWERKFEIKACLIRDYKYASAAITGFGLICGCFCAVLSLLSHIANLSFFGFHGDTPQGISLLLGVWFKIVDF